MEAGALSRIIRYFPPGALFRTNTSGRDLSIRGKCQKAEPRPGRAARTPWRASPGVMRVSAGPRSVC